MPEAALHDRVRGQAPRGTQRSSAAPLPAAASAPRERIFLGIQEVSGIVGDMARVLADYGHSVEGIVFENRFYRDPPASLRHLKAPSWIRSPRLRMLWLRLRLLLLFPGALFRSQIFVFVWSITFLPANLDLILLRLLRKKVILFNCGDDARFRPIHDRLDCEILHYDWLGGDPAARSEYLRSGNNFLKTFWFQKMQEWTGCRIVSSRNLATFQAVRCALFRFPQRPLATGPKRTREVPLVIHAPSNSMVKGTSHVLAAVETLRREGLSFEFRLIENSTNAEVLEALRCADIAVDQACGAWPGRFGIEALASGCVLVGGFRREYCEYPDTPPIVPFEPDAARLAEALRRLIVDAPERERLMAASYAYWTERYAPEVFHRWFLRVLDGTAESFEPIPDHKTHLLRFAAKRWQRWLIRCLH